jgi:hypothetical protein
MTSLGAQPLRLAEGTPRGAIDAIETLLKWGSIAYGLGFLTVLFNTVKLGIPTLELIEPVQVWVGIPLAIVFWLVIAAYKYFKRHAGDLSHDLALMRDRYRLLQELAERGDTKEAVARLLEFLLKDTVGTLLLPFVRTAWVMTLESSLLRSLFLETAEWILPSEDGSVSSQKRSEERLRKMLTHSAKFLSLLQKVRIVFEFFSNVITVPLILCLVTYMYIFVWYPEVPQTWGGGAPIRVTMVLGEEAIPAGDPEISAILLQSPNHEGLQKSTRTKQLDLLFAAQDAYYVRLDSGKVARFSAHAVSAMIFEDSVRKTSH